MDGKEGSTMQILGAFSSGEDACVDSIKTWCKLCLRHAAIQRKDRPQKLVAKGNVGQQDSPLKFCSSLGQHMHCCISQVGLSVHSLDTLGQPVVVREPPGTHAAQLRGG